MKKALVILLTLVMILGVVSSAIAAPPPKEKARDCELTVSKDVINIGESVDLTAYTKKHGSSYDVSWSDAGVDKGLTILLPDGRYKTTTTFSSDVAGTFVITYKITMSAGKSGVDFVGTDFVVIVVLPKNNDDPKVKHPAAPSIAGDLLRAAGLKPNSGDYKNFVAQVANKMDPGTDFNGVAKDNPRYVEEVKLFLIEIGAKISLTE